MSSSKFQHNLKENLLDQAQVDQILEKPGFGNFFTDHMAHIKFIGNQNTSHKSAELTHDEDRQIVGWQNHEIIPYGDIKLDPSAAVLHYGQEIFEGVKAYRHRDGSIWTFRPYQNAKRFNESAKRLALPELTEDDFVESIKELVKVDRRWVPQNTGNGESLYIRPFMFASEPFLGVRPSRIVDYYCILSPVSSYFGTPKPVDIWVETSYFRAGPGGTGAAKCGGNYAASLLPAQKASEKGCSQVLYLDARNSSSIEELGGMSFFAVTQDKMILTPKLNGNILDSITRKSILEVAKDRGYQVKELNLKIDEVVEAIKDSEIVEAFACGTAAVISPIGRLRNDNFDVSIDYHDDIEGKITTELRDVIVGIQTGIVDDKYDWMVKICN